MPHLTQNSYIILETFITPDLLASAAKKLALPTAALYSGKKYEVGYFKPNLTNLRIYYLVITCYLVGDDILA